jgi:hypothetical protein
VSTPIQILDGSFPGCSVLLSAEDLERAIDAYLVALGIQVSGQRTIYANLELCSSAEVYVHPSGFVCRNGLRYGGMQSGVNKS